MNSITSDKCDQFHNNRVLKRLICFEPHQVRKKSLLKESQSAKGERKGQRERGGKEREKESERAAFLLYVLVLFFHQVQQQVQLQCMYEYRFQYVGF